MNDTVLIVHVMTTAFKVNENVAFFCVRVQQKLLKFLLGSRQVFAVEMFFILRDRSKGLRWVGMHRSALNANGKSPARIRALKVPVLSQILE